MNQDDGDGEVGFEECVICVCRLVIKKRLIWDEQQVRVRVWRCVGFWKQCLGYLWDNKLSVGSGVQERDLLIEIWEFSALSIGKGMKEFKLFKNIGNNG